MNPGYYFKSEPPTISLKNLGYECLASKTVIYVLSPTLIIPTAYPDL